MKSIELWKYFPTYDREVWENSSKLFERVDIMNRSVLLTMLTVHQQARNVEATIQRPPFISDDASSDYLLRNSVLLYDYNLNALFPFIINVKRPIVDDSILIPYVWYVSLWEDSTSYANQLKYIQKKIMQSVGLSDCLDKSEIIIYKNLQLGNK